MEYVNLGRTGLKVSRLSYGAWVSFSNQLGVENAYEIMVEAFKGGVNFFDNAETYAGGEAEVIMGKAVKLGIKNGVWKRTDLVLSTKLFFGTGSKFPNQTGLSRKHIIEGMNGALERFDLDYVDLVFCHRPDPSTPIEETVRAMNYLIEKGQAFYWGTSEWSMEEIKEACDIADALGLIRPLFEQPQYNLVHRKRVEVEYGPLYDHMGLGLTIWSPLASGILSGKYGKFSKDPESAKSRMKLKGYEWLKLGERKDAIDFADGLKPIADEIGCTVAQLSLAWCLKNDHVSTVILGATNLDQIRENLKCLEFVSKITDEHMEKIEKLSSALKSNM